jgi:acyl-coenzyme A thioesterase 13
VRGEGEQRVFALRVEQRHANLGGNAHGGLLAALVDFALGRAIGAETGSAGAPATVSLTTDFLRLVRPGDRLEAHTEVERIGRTLAFADCSLTVEGREVVRGRAVFAVVAG